MKHIEKISISNARRFGNNINIDFGKGATILLAPNGTGKTTVFEAMELALTGEIRRLENSLDAIIREGMVDMSTRLEFSKDKYCQVDYVRGGNVQLSGIHDTLFKVDNSSSVPYLFRLTHLHEQRAGEWLVEKGENEAGDILRRLPIGSEINQIIKKKTSCLREMRLREKKAESDLEIAKVELSDFEELVNKRNSYISDNILMPIKEITSSLTLIGEMLNKYEDIEGYNVTQLNNQFEKIRVLLFQGSNEIKALSIKLNVLKERVATYVLNKNLLVQIQTRISEAMNRISELNGIIESAKQEKINAISRIGEIKTEKKNLGTILSMFDEAVQNQKQLDTMKIEIQQNRSELCNLKSSYQMTVEVLKKYERLRDQYNLINGEIVDNKKHLLQIEQKKLHQKKWVELSNTNKEIFESIIPSIDIKIDDCINKKTKIDAMVLKAEETHIAKKTAHDSLNIASSAIQEAVSNIRKYITENQQKCPVCNAIYEPGDLVKRIELSLKTINPTLPIAINEELEALEDFKRARKLQNETNKELEELQSKKRKEISRYEANHMEISESILPLFFECKTPVEAEMYLNEQIMQINKKITDLEANKNTFEPQINPEEIQALTLKRQEDERRISELTFNIERIDIAINTTTLEISNINDILKDKERQVIESNCFILEVEENKKSEVISNLDEVIHKG
uniref:hypothetical protein n=1 Tax=Lachnoclostridium sp. TaxID=2028282 RepID=UPI002898E25B